MSTKQLAFEGNPEEFAALIQKGIASDLEVVIKKKLLESVDGVISQMARDLAKNTSINVRSYLAMSDPNKGAFGPTLNILLSVNNKDVQYKEQTTIVDDGNGGKKIQHD